MAVLELNMSPEDLAGMERAAGYHGDTLGEACARAVSKYLESERGLSEGRQPLTEAQKLELRGMNAAGRQPGAAGSGTVVQVNIGDRELKELMEVADGKGLGLKDVCERAVNDYICDFLESINPVLS